MTKKDYERFVRMLTEMPDHLTRDEVALWIADTLQDDNPKFDREKFFARLTRLDSTTRGTPQPR